MKHSLLLFALAALPFIASAQTDTIRRDTVPSLAREEYCKVYTRARSFADYVSLFIDNGKVAVDPYRELRDGKNKVVKFNSEAAALNYMASKGWTILSTAVTTDNYLQYIMRRPLPFTAAASAGR